MNKLILVIVFFGALVLLGCQGRLNLIVANDTGFEIKIISAGVTHTVPSDANVRFASPPDHKIILKTEFNAYKFRIPLNPRPHVLNDYIDVHLVARIRVKSLNEIAIIPVHTNTISSPLLIAGQHVATQDARAP